MTGKYSPIRLYISEQQHRLLKSKVALEGITVAEWFRRKVDEYLSKN
jgi:hypothetical protein